MKKDTAHKTVYFNLENETDKKIHDYIVNNLETNFSSFVKEMVLKQMNETSK